MFRNLLSHIFSVSSVHRETDTGSRGIPNMCETVGYETQGPSPSSRAESRARIFEFPIFSKLRSGLCFYISLRIK